MISGRVFDTFISRGVGRFILVGRGLVVGHTTAF